MITSGGETSSDREVYTAHLFGTAKAGKRPRTEDEVSITFSQEKGTHQFKKLNRCPLARCPEKHGKIENDLHKVNFPLLGFTSTPTYLVGVINLPVFLSGGWRSLEINVTFIIVDTPATYNAILGRSTLNPHLMIQSTYHQLLKFLIPHGIGVVKGDQPGARSCYVQSTRFRVLKKEIVSIQTDEDPKERMVLLTPVEGLRKIQIEGTNKVVQIVATLPE